MNLNSRPFVILGLSLVLGFAVFGMYVGRAVRTGREFDRFLTVRGMSEREVKATLAIWPLHFSVSDADLARLKSRMDAQRQAVLAYLKKEGFEPAEITLGLPTVADREDERIRSEHPDLPRYRGSVTLVVRSTKVDLVKKSIQDADQLMEQGISLEEDGRDRTEFSYNAVNETKPDMIREATANARAAAEKFAQDSRSKVGRIRRATQGALEIENRDAATPERKILRVVTTVDFFLE